MKKILALLFRRKENADDLSGFPNWRIGLASAAAWSWGVSLIVGVDLMRSCGLLPFLVWSAGNILAIPIFGVVRRYLPISKFWSSFSLLILIFLMMDCFGIIINMKALLTGFGFGDTKGLPIPAFMGMGRDLAIYITVGYALFIFWYTTKGGLKLLMFSDLGSYLFQIATALFIAAYGFSVTEKAFDPSWLLPKGVEWVKYSFFWISSGVLATGHQWQKFSAIEEKRIFSASLWGGLFFALYMPLVFLCGLYFTEGQVTNIAFLILMFALATSTIDSAVAAMNYDFKRFNLANKLVGPAFALLTILSWNFLAADSTVTNLWKYMAQIRTPIIYGLILISVIITLIKIKPKKLPWLLFMNNVEGNKP